MTQAGDLNRLIRVVRRNPGRNATGNPNAGYQTVVEKMLAMRRDLKDSERIVAETWDHQLVTRFTVRDTEKSRQIRRSDRIESEGLTYEIEGIKEVPPGRRYLEITASRRGIHGSE